MCRSAAVLLAAPLPLRRCARRSVRAVEGARAVREGARRARRAAHARWKGGSPARVGNVECFSGAVLTCLFFSRLSAAAAAGPLLPRLTRSTYRFVAQRPAPPLSAGGWPSTFTTIGHTAHATSFAAQMAHVVTCARSDILNIYAK